MASHDWLNIYRAALSFGERAHVWRTSVSHWSLILICHLGSHRNGIRI